MPSRRKESTNRKLLPTTDAKLDLCRERDFDVLDRWRRFSMCAARAREAFDRAHEAQRRWEKRWVDGLTASAEPKS
jgi:hypothetical protein